MARRFIKNPLSFYGGDALLSYLRFFSCLCFILVPSLCLSETIILHDGSSFSGDIVRVHGSVIDIAINQNLQKFHISDIQRIESPDGKVSRLNYVVQCFVLSSAMAQKRYQDVVGLCEELMLPFKDDKDMQYFCALARRFSGDDVARRVAYEKLVDSGTARTEILNSVGGDYAFSGAEDKAERLFQEVLRQNPSDKVALKNLGVIYLKKEDWRQAETIFVKLLETSPQNMVFLHNMGVIYMKMEKMDEAEKIWDKMLEIDPSVTYPKDVLLSIKKRRTP